MPFVLFPNFQTRKDLLSLEVSAQDINAQLQYHTFGLPAPFVGMILVCPDPVISTSWISGPTNNNFHASLAVLCQHAPMNQKGK